MMIQQTPLTLPTTAQLPVRLAEAYLRRHTNHVVVNALPEELTLSFGQLCPE